MYSAIVFLPLLGAILGGIISLVGAHNRHPSGLDMHADNGGHEANGDGHGHAPAAQGSRAAELITTGFLIIAAILSWVAFFDVGLKDGDVQVSVLPWIASGSLSVDWAFRIDTLTAVMLVVVTTVSALVHVYSIGYMSHDPNRPRFFAYLSLFTFAMLMLVTADNFVQLFFGWEGVGLASYLLIGFWYQRPSANAAAIKAFVVNRVGDFGFSLGIFGVFVLFGSVNFDAVFANAADATGRTLYIFGSDIDALTIVCLLLFMGAMGKSAQFLLHTWLPDAMEGPTPVSALIHAATMVTAGVFMVARLSPLFELSYTALTVVTFIGATTAFFAATIGLVQNDIKRVIAYSTCSQLGYMFAAIGVGAYSAGIFHLFTHAFFKALLFLGSGAVIHAMSDEQDMRKMGGLRTKIPVTYWMMVIGTLALTGFPLTAGWVSKDAIIEATFVGENPMAGYAFGLTLFAAMLTAFYSWRLIFMTFHGKSRASAEVQAHVHESPMVMLVPLFVLAIGALGAGLAFKSFFIGADYEAFWRGAIFLGEENHILHAMHEVPAIIVWMPTVMMVTGFVVAWYMYIRNPAAAPALARQFDLLYKFLLNKWYFDEIYDFLFVRPAKWLGRFLWKKGDGWLIDGFGPDGISARVIDVTRRVVQLQTGYLYHYAFAMLIGVTALITWYMFAGGAH
ncbi:NADH-quinone oxidoreductase subunit L [Microbaculum marinisediminis]|uniref:NADH-quinone oxidoreductase subunit L n=1 Tax=Microbaculum marinisediminis TaxID=2931392 RepID=A0AAW5R6Y2_9HYPH|nr:NADH-quinone oxidoreductase subunit L [Microbaculum sp. A6E488]MCT8974389.1 NADH-quinone oxidoreductase subunit L [Microbaculum sp. A6E488]